MSVDWHDVLANPFAYDDWTQFVVMVTLFIACGIRDKHLQPPVEVEITSAQDETLLAACFFAEAYKPIVLHSNEALWDRPDIFPLTAIWEDGFGVKAGYEFRSLSQCRKPS